MTKSRGVKAKKLKWESIIVKIAIIMNSFYGQSIGGAEYQAYLIAQELIRNGHEVYYLYLTNGQPINNHYKIKLHPLRKIPHIKGVFIEIPFYYFQISRVLRKIKPDIIYTRRRSALCIICAIYAKLYNIKTIFHIAHDNDLIEHKFKLFSKNILYLLEQIIYFKYCIGLFSKIISQTKYQADNLKRRFRLDCCVIPNGHPKSKCTATHDSDKGVIVIWVANMRIIKQHDLFLKLAEKIGNKAGITFMMIGRPPEGLKRIAFLNKIQKITNLNYLGEINNDKVNEYLCKCHIFVNTALSEGFANTFIQAWMRKLPVVSLNVDPDNVLKNEGIGYQSGSFEQMIVDVRTLIKDPNLRNTMGSKAYKYAMENFSMQNIKKVSDLITGLKL